MHAATNAAVLKSKPPVHRIPHHNRFINTNSPDINLDRDLIPERNMINPPRLAIENSEIIGMENSNLNREGYFVGESFKVSLATIIISGLVFLAILAWFDFIQSAFFIMINSQTQLDQPVQSKFWYAIFCTIIVVALVYAVFQMFGSHLHW